MLIYWFDVKTTASIWITRGPVNIIDRNWLQLSICLRLEVDTNLTAKTTIKPPKQENLFMNYYIMNWRTGGCS